MVGKTAEAAHPKYIDMVKAALGEIKDRKGISRPAIQKYVVTKYNIPADKIKHHLKTTLKRGVEQGKFVQEGQRFRKSTKAEPKKKASKVSKKAAKKPSSKTKTKTKVARKSATKKSAKTKTKSPKTKKPKVKKAPKTEVKA